MLFWDIHEFGALHKRVWNCEVKIIRTYTKKNFKIVTKNVNCKKKSTNQFLTILITKFPAAYLRAAEGLEGEIESGGVHGTELWALAIGATAAILLLIVLALLCFAHRFVSTMLFNIMVTLGTEFMGKRR